MIPDGLYEIGEMLGLEQNDINNVITNTSDTKKANITSPTNLYKDYTFYGTVSINHFK